MLLKPKGLVSMLFIEKGISSFADACTYVRSLPYGRNSDKTDPAIIFKEQRGTCSTKHAALKLLAAEQGNNDIKLVLGIFKMSRQNTPPVATTLARYGLDYLPEAHNYLKLGDEIIDCTKNGFGKANYINDLLSETEIHTGQITDYKVAYHKQIINEWLVETPAIPYTLQELWAIREQCIKDLEG